MSKKTGTVTSVQHGWPVVTIQREPTVQRPEAVTHCYRSTHLSQPSRERLASCLNDVNCTARASFDSRDLTPIITFEYYAYWGKTISMTPPHLLPPVALHEMGETPQEKLYQWVESAPEVDVDEIFALTDADARALYQRLTNGDAS